MDGLAPRLEGELGIIQGIAVLNAFDSKRQALADYGKIFWSFPEATS